MPFHSRTRPMRRKFLIWCAFIFVAAAAILGSLYARVIPGLSSARTEPPAAELLLATWLLHQSVIRDLPRVARMPPAAAAAPPTHQHYVGSAGCKNCHESWR
jgi:hypothetical protein